MEPLLPDLDGAVDFDVILTPLPCPRSGDQPAAGCIGEGRTDAERESRARELWIQLGELEAPGPPPLHTLLEAWALAPWLADSQWEIADRHLGVQWKVVTTDQGDWPKFYFGDYTDCTIVETIPPPFISCFPELYDGCWSRVDPRVEHFD